MITNGRGPGIVSTFLVPGCLVSLRTGDVVCDGGEVCLPHIGGTPYVLLMFTRSLHLASLALTISPLVPRFASKLSCHLSIERGVNCSPVPQKKNEN